MADQLMDKLVEALLQYQSYATSAEAAQAALRQAATLSSQTGVEHGGRIFRHPSKELYYHTEPVPGERLQVDVTKAPIPEGAPWTGSYHAHALLSLPEELQRISDEDIIADALENRETWMTYFPSADTAQVLAHVPGKGHGKGPAWKGKAK